MEDAEEKNNDQDNKAASPLLWRASANAVEGSIDLSKPKSFQDAMNGPQHICWREAIRMELKSMRLRGVFRASKLPHNQRAIGTKWVFKIKRRADRSIDKYKSRLVTKSFNRSTALITPKLFCRLSSM